MSLIAKLLGFTGLPQWALEVIFLAIISGAGVTWWKVHNAGLIKEGINRQRTEDQLQTDRLVREAALKTQIQHERALQAEARYRETKQTMDDYIARQPLPSVSQLCQPAPVSGGSGLSPARPPHLRNAETGPRPTLVQSVLGRDNRFAGNRLLLLRAFGGVAGETSGSLREFQDREVKP